MRTTIDIEDEKLERLLLESGGKSKKKAVETAITEYLKMKNRQKLALMVGGENSIALTLEDLDNMRESR